MSLSPFGRRSERIPRRSSAWARLSTSAAELQRQGKWLHLWRVVGQWANISIFRVESPGELHEILESLPLHPFMETKVIALCRHPGSIALDTD